MYHLQEGVSNTAQSPVWSLVLFLCNDRVLEEKAFYLLFDEYRNLTTDSLMLRHFLSGSSQAGAMEVRTLLDFRHALEGLELFLALVYDYRHPFQHLLDCIKSGQLHRYDVEYLTMEVHRSLCTLRSTAELIDNEDNVALPPAAYELIFRKECESIAGRLSKEKEDAFLEDVKVSKSLQRHVDLSGTSDEEKRKLVAQPSPRRNKGDKSQLCMAQVKFDSKAPKKGGQSAFYTACEWGHGCVRCHPLSESKVIITKAEALKQIGRVIIDPAVVAATTAWVEKQTCFK